MDNADPAKMPTFGFRQPRSILCSRSKLHVGSNAGTVDDLGSCSARLVTSFIQAPASDQATHLFELSQTKQGVERSSLELEVFYWAGWTVPSQNDTRCTDAVTEPGSPRTPRASSPPAKDCSERLL